MKRQFGHGMSIVVADPPPIRKCRIALLLLPLLWLLGVGSAAAAPANDLCAGAELVPGAGPFPYLTAVTDITTATLSVNDPPITNEFLSTKVIRSVWYRFTPAATATYTISTCTDVGAATTVRDTVLGLYTSVGGCNGPFTPLALGDEDCGPNSSQASITTHLLADTTYYILVWKYCFNCSEDNLNEVQLMIDGSIPPPNDDCETATPIQVNLPIDGTTVGAEDNYRISGTNAFWGIDQTPSTAMGRDVVFSFTAPATTTYSFKATGYDVNQNLVLYIIPDCPTGPTPIGIANSLAAANRSGVNSAEEVFCLNLVAGQQVFIVVDDNNSGNTGSRFTLEVTRCLRENEPNNSPETASPYVCGISGALSPALDVDFHALGSFPAGWRAFVMVDGEASRIANYDLRITTTTDTLEFDDDNNSASFGDSSPNVAGTLLTGGPIFASVNYFGGNEREPYRIHAVVQPPLASATVESEPNNSWAEANSSEGNYFYGTLNGPGLSTDIDVYAFSVAEGDLIFVSLDGDPHRTNAPVNARLELLDSSGNLLMVVNDGGSASFGGTNVSLNTLTAFGPSAPAEALTYRSPIEGTFYARVSISGTAAGNARSGNYLLSISRNCLIGLDAVNHFPVITNVVLASSVSVGTTITLTGASWDPDLGDATTVTVDWGDGATNQVDFLLPGLQTFSVPHQFTVANTNFTVKISLRDSHGGSATWSTNIATRVQSEAARFTSITPLGNGQFRLELEGTPQGLYLIEKCDALGSDWTELGTRTAGSTGAFSIDDPAPAMSSRFYRAVSVP